MASNDRRGGRRRGGALRGVRGDASAGAGRCVFVTRSGHCCVTVVFTDEAHHILLLIVTKTSNQFTQTLLM